jgi:protein involved in polysaccharide export with SLBB domain
MEFVLIGNSIGKRLLETLRATIPHIVASCLLFALATSQSVAQNVQLTPEQQQMLDQLPPAQRQQALLAIEQLNRQQSDDTVETESDEDLPRLQQEGETQREQFLDTLGGAEAEGGSRLVIDLNPKFDLEPSELSKLQNDQALQRIQGSRYYELDESGILVLPGLPSVPLLGLTAEAIEQRLGAEPSLDMFDVSVSILDVESIGADALEPFGYNVFAPMMSGFEPVTTGPVPPDYVLGPGDSIRVQLFGNVSGIYEFEVTRDGILNLPQLGPVTVAGLPFYEFRTDLNERVQEMLIGTQVSVTMGRLRTIQVFVLGDANRPGSFVVSSLSTISSALYDSGGISEIGSLRNIQLKRQGQLVATLDLYDLLLNGDTSGDRRLQSGDVIFIPPVGGTVGVGGAVRRPAIYELDGDTTVSDVIRFAGGLLPEAFPEAGRVERINTSKGRVVISVDADSVDGGAMGVAGGDTLIIPEVLADLNDSVILTGHVQRPGPYQWRAGMRLTDLLPTALDLIPGADADYVLVRREDGATRRVHVVSAKLSQAWTTPGSPENIALQARDTIHVFSLAFGRQRVIAPVLEELQLQSSFGEPFSQVQVAGRVRAPGTYPLEPGMRVSDLIRAGGNLSEEAFTLDAELTRYSVIDGEYRATDVIDIDLDAILRGDETVDVVLLAHDHLSISTIPKWDSEWTVSLEGEVLFPGDYRVRRGETLRQVLERAGGLTDDAFAPGSIFLRDSLRQREQEQIDLLARRLESDLVSVSLQNVDTSGAETLSTGRVLLEQLRDTRPVGRLVIDLEALAARAPTAELVDDVELRDGDRLLVPTRPQVVTVIGEVQQSTSHLFQPGLTRNDYIEMSGGITRRADRKHIYVVRASGSVVAGRKSRWFGRRGDTEIRPGDTIVAPLETDRIRPLTLWTQVTQILYQAALAVAAIQTFDN